MSLSVCAEAYWLKTSFHMFILMCRLFCAACILLGPTLTPNTMSSVLLNALLHLNNGRNPVSMFILQVQHLLWHSICYLDMAPPFSATWLGLHTQHMPRKYAWHVKFHKSLVCILVHMLDLKKRTCTILRATHSDWPVFTCHSVPHAASKPLRVTIKKTTPNG